MISVPKIQRRKAASPTDVELVGCARRGDAASLGALLERYRAPLYGHALGMLGYGPEAQDAVHDTFLVALGKLEQLREPEAVGAWLHRILRNVCLMRLRAGHVESPLDEPRFERGFSESSVEEAVERLALREWVWAALDRLPERLRVTVMLRYFGSFASYTEVAAILGIPVGTVRSRLNQAKVRLAEELLESAGRDHGEARRLSESRTRFFEAAYDEYNRGEGYTLLMGAFSRDLVMDFSDGTSIHEGYEFMVGDLARDIEVGMKMRPTAVMASRDVAVIECEIENPPEDPAHCPSAISQVAFYRDGRISRLRWHLAPRPSEEGCWEETVLAPLNIEGK